MRASSKTINEPRASARAAMRRQTAFDALLRWLAVAGLLWATSGCLGPQAGVLLYHLGLVKPEKTPAEFKLTKAPTLILVDDDWDLVHPGTAKDALVDALAKELRNHDLAERVTTNEELARLRQAEPNWDRRGAREVGQMAHADIVLWLKVVRFSLEDNLELAYQTAHFGVTLKVLNAKATDRDQVLLWPKEREGKLVEATVSSHDLRQCKNVGEAHARMADALAPEIAKLFYEFQPEQ